MKKILMCLALASTALFLMAGPALAQARDPFEPLVTESSGSTAGAPSDTSGSGSSIGNGQVQGQEALPSTGADTSVWLGLGYFLVAAGTGALVLSKVLAPQRS